MAFGRQVCTFVLDVHLCGIEAGNVQEVVEFAEITPVPLTPPAIRGLANLRSQIVTVIDLRALLEIDAAERPCEHPIGVIIRAGDDHLGLLVDRIGDVIIADEQRFEVPPETLTGVARDCIRGAYKLDETLLLMLDLETIANQA